ncbi:hypothetical protein MRX96_029218 [Rhipicephalus microplus]
MSETGYWLCKTGGSRRTASRSRTFDAAQGLPALVDAAECDAYLLTGTTCLATELCVGLAKVGLGRSGGGGGGGGGTGGGGKRGLTGGRCLAAELAVAQAMWYSLIGFGGFRVFVRPLVNVLLVAVLRSSTGLLDTNSLGRVGGLLVMRVNVPKRLRYTVVKGPMPKLRQRPECGSCGSVFVIVRL